VVTSGTRAGLVLELLDHTTQCHSLEEYERARNAWLDRHIGFDTCYVGAALPEAPRTPPRVVGISSPDLSRCEAHIDRYWADLTTLNCAAERAGGAVQDRDVLSHRARDRSPFYREVVARLGVHTAAISVLRTRRKLIGCLYLGRLSRGAHFRKELLLLRAALPALSLGKEVFDAAPPLPSHVTTPLFTKRENEVLELVVRGLTNKEIAARLGSSPLTVKNQLAAMFEKSGVKNRAELAHSVALAR
jgi:DNA-binding CsgD family transcriptional regulator